MPDGRFAPSPTGPLHLGNLRTALLAWLFARADGSRFLVRVEDLDRVAARPEHEAAHLRDLAALGLAWDGPVVRQSERFDRYHAAVGSLTAAGLTYPCWCTRREVLEAARAPHGDFPEGAYAGTCRDLPAAARAEREASGRSPSLRLRAGGEVVSFVDRLAGPTSAAVDDFVLRRADGTPAYNVAVVVDDAAQAIGEVVRADDLLSTTPRQILVARLLGLDVPSYAHVPLVLGPDGERLAKRHGSVTLDDRLDAGATAAEVLALLGSSLGLCAPDEAVTPSVLLDRFDPAALPREPWVLAP